MSPLSIADPSRGDDTAASEEEVDWGDDTAVSNEEVGQEIKKEIKQEVKEEVEEEFEEKIKGQEIKKTCSTRSYSSWEVWKEQEIREERGEDKESPATVSQATQPGKVGKRRRGQPQHRRPKDIREKLKKEREAASPSTLPVSTSDAPKGGSLYRSDPSWQP